MSPENRPTTLARALENRCAIITGASCGLGREIARSYLQAGASVALCARDATTLDAAASELTRHAQPGQALLAAPADISRAADVARLIDTTLARFGRLDILVNNAGVAGPSGAVETVAWEQWVSTLEINLLGAVLLSRAVLPHLKRARRGKIIQLSGGGATRPLPMRSAYAASKAAVVRFIETLAEETRPCGIDVNALAPGALDTRMLDELIAAGPERLGREQYERCLQQKRDGSVPLSCGAELAVFLGSEMSDGITGKLLSAVWDPWQALPGYLDDLNRTDVYTLRRIVPRERRLSWGDDA
jgi:NAD(P)-dependent dehydrogenase (short-subunit alcohol dehydrogenase family)